MKALLMHRERDLDLQQALPWNEAALMQDLELATLLRAMARDDEFLRDVARKVILSGLQSDRETILYRQAILQDCLRHPDVLRTLYDLALETIEAKRKHWFGIFGSYPLSILSGAIELMQVFVGMLKQLRRIAEAQAGRFESEGFTRLFAMLQAELSDEYFARIQKHLTELKFARGVLISARLGEGNEGIDACCARRTAKDPTGCSGFSAKGRARTPSTSIRATRTAHAPWVSCATAASTSWPMRLRSRPITS
jgi:hypothetical protein